MRNKYLVLFDFDQTLADTSKQESKGIGVEEASGLAEGQLFGDEGLSYFWDKLGGLQNREPGELVKLIAQELHWENEIDLRTATELFVQGKLSYLLEGINASWPKLYPGVKDFFKDAEAGEIPVDTGIVSSGHDEFIKKTFDVNDLEPPAILVTSDVLRERDNPYAPPRHKPSPYQIAIAHRLWLYGNGDDLHKEGMLYVGDDPVKDGELAYRSKIPFIFVPFSGRAFVPDKDKGQIAVSDFREIGKLFRENRDMLERGADMTEILLGKARSEVFGKTQEGGLHFGMRGEDRASYAMMRR